MAFLKCGGSGALTETTLWTNSSPTSSFSGQTVTLSDDITNYTYICVEWCRTKSDTSDTAKIYMSADTFVSSGTHSTSGNKLNIGITDGSGVRWVRVVSWVSDTSIYIGTGIRQGDTTVSTTVAIPTNIYGLK